MAENDKQDLKVRTKQFALQIIRLYTSLPKTTEAQVIGKQVLRSGTSVGAQYREAQRAKSDADFINKVEGSLQDWTRQVIGSNYSRTRECFLLKN
jgi:four helix bundle protein